MEVQIEVGKGIQCDGIEIMFGDSISSVVKAVGEVDKYEDNYYFYESSLLVHVDSNNCIDEIEIRNDEEHSHVVMLNGTNIFSEMKDVVIELIARLFSPLKMLSFATRRMPVRKPYVRCLLSFNPPENRLRINPIISS